MKTVELEPMPALADGKLHIGNLVIRDWDVPKYRIAGPQGQSSIANQPLMPILVAGWFDYRAIVERYWKSFKPLHGAN
jgi:hypothetical protein